MLLLRNLPKLAPHHGFAHRDAFRANYNTTTYPNISTRTADQSGGSPTAGTVGVGSSGGGIATRGLNVGDGGTGSANNSPGVKGECMCLFPVYLCLHGSTLHSALVMVA